MAPTKTTKKAPKAAPRKAAKKATTSTKRTTTTKRTRKPRVSPFKPFLDDEGIICIPPLLLFKFRAVDAECRNAKLSLSHKLQELNQAMEINPQIKQILVEKGNLTEAVRRREREAAQVQLEIQTTLGVSLHECSIDDQTGRLYMLGNDEETQQKTQEFMKEADAQKRKLPS